MAYLQSENSRSNIAQTFLVKNKARSLLTKPQNSLLKP